MKRLALLFSCSAALLCPADLANVHTVYLLKMAKGLDQFLANRLTSDHVFQIVTDPKLADTVFTDQIGEGFQMKLEELFPTPESAKPAPPPPPKPEKTGEEANPLLGDTVNKLSNPSMNSSFGRATGTVFLVDAKSRQLVWSVYQPPKGGTAKDMDRTATDIVNRIKRDLKGK
ncbi:MAG: hypothetical protein NTW28_10660 [Candidatus Solibacter sp.]|nr:hypothetical protein [Candidatus Solibacter sp.]